MTAPVVRAVGLVTALAVLLAVLIYSGVSIRNRGTAGSGVVAATPGPTAFFGPTAVPADYSSEGAGAAAERLVRDTSAAVPEAVWREALATSVAGDPADIAAMARNNAAAVELLGADTIAQLEASASASGHLVRSLEGDSAAVDVFVSQGVETVAVPVELVWSDDRWLMVVPSGGTWWGKVKATK